MKFSETLESHEDFKGFSSDQIKSFHAIDISKLPQFSKIERALAKQSYKAELPPVDSVLASSQESNRDVLASFYEKKDNLGLNPEQQLAGHPNSL